jgi:D-methionine transport system substrate-binding protein
MKKIIALLVALVLTLSLTAAFADGITIAVPNDPTNEGRALLLLQAYGLITVDENAGITATVADITENPLNIEFVEVEAALVPNALPDVDYAAINGNYALAAELPAALLYENAASPYVNVVSVNEADKDSDKAKVLAAAILSQQVVDYFATYEGQAISVIENPTDGYDATVDYDALKGETIKVVATLDPHSFVLEKVVKDILAAKGITLEVIVVDDYVTPNTAVNDGDAFANYFAHQPYQDNFNAEKGTNLVTIAGVHVEPMGLYAGKQADLAALGLAE